MLSRVAKARDPRDSMARVEKDGEVVGYLSAATMCWFPRRPQFMRARREGFETVLRCGHCPGCREFDVLILCRRLKETYKAIAKGGLTKSSRSRSVAIDKSSSPEAQLFALRIDCQKDDLFRLNRRLHRWRGVEVEPGFFRWGTGAFVVLSRRPAELVAKLEELGWRVRTFPIGNLRRARSWRIVARGLIVAREAYGEDINRYYRRGLSPRDKEQWEVKNIGEYQRYNRAEDPRSTSRDLGSICPPRMWRLPRGVRVRVDSRLRTARNPEAVTQLMPELQAMVAGIGNGRAEAPKPLTPEEIESNRQFNLRMARTEASVVVNAKLSDFSPSISSEGVTEDLTNSDPPISAWEAEQAREQQRIEQRKRLWEKKTAEGLARLEKLAKGSS